MGRSVGNQTHQRNTGRRSFLLLSLLGLTSACASVAEPAAAPAPSSKTSPSPAPTTAGSTPPPPQPKLRVGFCGGPGAPALGRMTGNLDAAGDQLRQQLSAYPAQPAQPVVELIATRVHSTPGADGRYRTRETDRTIQSYLGQARRLNGMLLLNIQPGEADFPGEVRAYERWLTEPDVGIALDPEWATDPGVVPGTKYGHVDGTVLDQVSAYLSGLVAQHGLPPKVLAYHQVAASVVTNEGALRPHEGVIPIKVVDGIGAPGSKISTWNVVMKDKPGHVQAGFKLFYDEDTRKGGRLMSPAEVMALRPTPTYVVYE